MAIKKQVLYGVGKAALIGFESGKLISQNDLQDLTVESSVDFEDVTGGNRIFAIASFPKDKAITISATNATFAESMIEYLEGATPTKGSKEKPELVDFVIPSNGEYVMEFAPVQNSVLIDGFTEASETTPQKGQYKVMTEEKKIKFNVADAGSHVNVRYLRMSSENTVTYDITSTTMPEPFRFEYVFDIHDTDSKVYRKAALIIYKLKCTSGFSINPQHLTPFAPKFEAKSLDPQRADGKMWSFLIDGVEVA